MPPSKCLLGLLALLPACHEAFSGYKQNQHGLDDGNQLVLDIRPAGHQVSAHADVGQEEGRKRNHLRVVAGKDCDDDAVPRIGRGILPVETLVHGHLLHGTAETCDGAGDHLGKDDDLCRVDAGILRKLRVASGNPDFVAEFRLEDENKQQNHDADGDQVAHMEVGLFNERPEEAVLWYFKEAKVPASRSARYFVTV